MKYRVTIAMSYIDTIEVEADSKDEAMQTAWDLYNEDRAVQGEGEVILIEKE